MTTRIESASLVKYLISRAVCSAFIDFYFLQFHFSPFYFCFGPRQQQSFLIDPHLHVSLQRLWRSLIHLHATFTSFHLSDLPPGPSDSLITIIMKLTIAAAYLSSSHIPRFSLFVSNIYGECHLHDTIPMKSGRLAGMSF